MSKRGQGEILKSYFKSKGLEIQYVAKVLQYKDRAGLNYQLRKKVLDEKFKAAVRKGLNLDVDQILQAGKNDSPLVPPNTQKDTSHINNVVLDSDNENRHLKDIVNLQKELIALKDQFLLAQSIRHEAAMSHVIEMQNLILKIIIDPTFRPDESLVNLDLSALRDKAELAVKDRIKKIYEHLGSSNVHHY